MLVFCKRLGKDLSYTCLRLACEIGTMWIKERTYVTGQMEMVVAVELGNAPASAEFGLRGLALGWNSKKSLLELYHSSYFES